MKSFRLVGGMTILSASLAAGATPLVGSPGGLYAPMQTITFGEVPLPMDTLITTQYAGLGVTFSPGIYYNPFGSNGGLLGVVDDVGNFTSPTEPAFIDPVTLDFGSAETGVAFQAFGGGPFTIQAFLSGTLVDSFVVNFPVDGSFDGFENESFNSIVITANGNSSDPYYVLDDLELTSAPVVTRTAPTPELSSVFLLGTGLLSTAGVVRKRAVSSRV